MIKELEFIRKTVIMACHPECRRYENALKKEIGFGCWIEFKKSKTRCMLDFFNQNGLWTGTGLNDYIDINKIKIIGQPITLSRLLIALKYEEIRLSIEMDNSLYFVEIDNSVPEWQSNEKSLFTWDLTKDLDQQETKTILAISKLLDYEKQK